MKSTLITAGKAFLVLAVLGTTVGCAANRRLQAENTQLKDQVKRLSDALSAGDAESASLRDRNAALEDQLANATADVAAMDSELEEMRAKLASKGFDVSVSGGKVIVNLPAKILYASGSALVTDGGKAKLHSLAGELKGSFSDYEIEIQGHTDTDPIVKTKDKYKSNWELSYDRAQNVAYYLMQSGGISPERVHVSAYGQHHPVASNSSESGKSQNRRVQVVVMKEGS
jgi:chemotaxis protein MotB